MKLESYKKRLPQIVLVAIALAVVTGFLFRHSTQVFQPFADVYVMMLESVVYPYLIASLVHGIGSISPAEAKRLFRSSWITYAIYLLVAMVVLIFIAMLIPTSHTSVVVPEGRGVLEQYLLNITIPSDLLTAIAKNYIPAIVIFSIVFGIALQYFNKKEIVLEILITIKQASLKIWGWIVLFSPLAIFCLIAHTVGTVDIANIQVIGIFLVLYFLAVLILAFWVFPAIIAAMTPVGYLEVMSHMRQAFIVAVATTLSVAALPAIEQMLLSIIEKLKVQDKDNKDLVNTTLTLSYPLGQLGNLFLYIFIIFAAYYFQKTISESIKLYLPFVTALSAIGSPSSAIASSAFLANWAHLPAGVTSLYVELSAITRYGQVIASVMGMAFISLMVILTYYRKLKIKWRLLLINLILLLSLFFVIVQTGGALKNFLFAKPKSLLSYQLPKSITQGVDATVYLPQQKLPSTPKNLTMIPGYQYITENKVLKVGYNPNAIPFSYFNNKGELVGLDVALMYQLAKALHIKLVFIPYTIETLTKDLLNRKFFLAIGGVYVTMTRLENAAFSKPYLTSLPAFLVKKPATAAYRNLSAHNKTKASIAYFHDDLLANLALQYFPDAVSITQLNKTTLKNNPYQAILLTEYLAQSYAEINSNKYIAVIPSDLKRSQRVLIAYMLSKNDGYLLNFLNYWLKVQKNNGFIQAQKNYWLQKKAN